MNITENFIDIESLCNGDYVSIVLGMLFFSSELLGLIQKSNCNKNDEIIDTENNEIEFKIDKQPSFLENTNGILHSLVIIFKKFKK